MARYTMSIGILAQREVKRLARINYKFQTVLRTKYICGRFVENAEDYQNEQHVSP